MHNHFGLVLCKLLSTISFRTAFYTQTCPFAFVDLVCVLSNVYCNWSMKSGCVHSIYASTNIWLCFVKCPHIYFMIQKYTFLTLLIKWFSHVYYMIHKFVCFVKCNPHSLFLTDLLIAWLFLLNFLCTYFFQYFTLLIYKMLMRKTWTCITKRRWFTLLAPRPTNIFSIYWDYLVVCKLLSTPSLRKGFFGWASWNI